MIARRGFGLFRPSAGASACSTSGWSHEMVLLRGSCWVVVWIELKMRGWWWKGVQESEASPMTTGVWIQGRKRWDDTLACHYQSGRLSADDDGFDLSWRWWL